MKQAEVGLVRRLGPFDTTMVVVGVVLGAGIFITTGFMAKSAPSAGLILLVWVAGGLLTLAGALTYAELGAAMPEAGGQYVFLREAYGPLVGFLFGWITFLAYLSGVIAYMSVALAEYASTFFPFMSGSHILFAAEMNVLGREVPLSVSMAQVSAIIIIGLLSVANFIGVVVGKTIQNVFTVTKIGTILVFVLLGLTMGKGSPVDFSINPTGMSLGSLIMGSGVALITASVAFDGWNCVTFLSGEIKNPKRDLPLALLAGTVLITILYVLMNYVYLRALSVTEMAGALKIAEDATASLYGTNAAGLISAAVVISIFGGLNGVILAGPRVYYAMAKDKLFFERAARVHTRFRTPGFAILLQAIWASLLTLTGTVEQLITFVMFVGVSFWVVTGTSVFILRRKYPELPRPYKTWGYPIVPMVFVVASSCIVINTLVQRPLESMAGVGLTLIGVPAYVYWRKKW
jgi:APA family basic amino acid/polyamine antiporter